MTFWVPLVRTSSCDIQIWWPSVENVKLGLRPCATFSTSGPSYFDVELTTVHHLYNVILTKWRSFCDHRFWDVTSRAYSISPSRHGATETHMPYGITQCYLPPGRGDITEEPATVWQRVSASNVRPTALTSLLTVTRDLWPWLSIPASYCQWSWLIYTQKSRSEVSWF